jgi:hypothetical protein
MHSHDSQVVFLPLLPTPRSYEYALFRAAACECAEAETPGLSIEILLLQTLAYRMAHEEA